MQETYDPKAVEAAAQQFWNDTRAYEVAEASALQPFAYLQLVWVTAIGLTLFGIDLFFASPASAPVDAPLALGSLLAVPGVWPEQLGQLAAGQHRQARAERAALVGRQGQEAAEHPGVH